jgi:transcriptional regulator with XRE-family HTH domain
MAFCQAIRQVASVVGRSRANMSDTNSNSENRSTESQPQPNVQPFHDEQRLRRLYHEEQLSQERIGERFGVSQQTIGYWMAEHGIEARPPMSERDRSISVSAQQNGYTQFKVPNFDSDDLDDREPTYTSLYQHQLVALLASDDGDWLFSIKDIFHGDTHVHHDLNCGAKLDHQDNLDVMTKIEHLQAHSNYDYLVQAEFVLGEIYDEYDGEPDQDEITHTGDVNMGDLEDDSVTVDTEAD